jgi:hypothetical protein
MHDVRCVDQVQQQTRNQHRCAFHKSAAGNHQTPKRNNDANAAKRQTPASSIQRGGERWHTAGSKLSRILEAIKPEAVYFTEQNGQRGAVLIVDKIPALAEPWFLTFQADVEFRVVMSPDDLKRAGLGELGKQWS